MMTAEGSADAKIRSDITALQPEIYPLVAERRFAPLPSKLNFKLGVQSEYVKFEGFSFEPGRVWTNGPVTKMFLSFPTVAGDIAVRFDIVAFTWPGVLLQQDVEVKIGGRVVANWTFVDRLPTSRFIHLTALDIKNFENSAVEFHVPGCAKPSTLGLSNDERDLGIAFTGVSWEEVLDRRLLSDLTRHIGRMVGTEARKSFDQKVMSGFWNKYITGPSVLDVGFKGYGPNQLVVVPIVENAIGIDLDYPNYDGKTLPFGSNSQDAVYSSHCLEHIPHYITAIQEWHRVTKIGGHIITVVPNSYLYERKRTPPSNWNGDHQRFYSPCSLLAEFEKSLLPNSYRVRHLAENDQGYIYESNPERHPSGCYEIELVIQKIEPPAWKMGD